MVELELPPPAKPSTMVLITSLPSLRRVLHAETNALVVTLHHLTGKGNNPCAFPLVLMIPTFAGKNTSYLGLRPVHTCEGARPG